MKCMQMHHRKHESTAVVEDLVDSLPIGLGRSLSIYDSPLSLFFAQGVYVYVSGDVSAANLNTQGSDVDAQFAMLF